MTGCSYPSVSPTAGNVV